MIEWQVTEFGVRVSDSGNADLPIRAPDLDGIEDGGSIPRPVDVTVDCRARELRFPVAVVRVTSLTTDESHELGNDTGPLELPADEYLIDVDAEIKTYLRVEGPLTLSKPPTFDEVVVSFPVERSLTAGFRSRNGLPDGTITVPATPEGVAAALSVMPSAHKTTGPERSFPTLRSHPPLVETGEDVAVPEGLADAVPDSGVEVAVPPSLRQLFVVAPLSYYLQAEVTVEDRPAPVLRAPAVGLAHELDPVPDLQRDRTELLRTVLFLDCLVRNAGPYSTSLAEASLLDALDLDAASLYEASPVERLETYLDVPYAAIEQRLPDWHLSMYVSPEAQHVGTLPFLLDQMALTYVPKTSELEGSELVERSLDDFYRSGAGQVASVDIEKPELRGGRVHGWLADGIPIDVFKSTPTAYHNRLRHLRGSSDGIDVTVVLNDDDMADEHADVAEVYRQRAEDLPIDLRVADHLGVDELGRVFEAENDFVHYIGHCETEGLRCPDGYLSVANLGRVNTETFFLNACGSFHEGMDLIAKGSVAGAITFSQVLNDHAVKVGSAFARLLVHGFGIERAMRLARRRIMMGKDYAVVGDGTHTLTQSENRLPTSATLEAITEDQYLLSYDQYSTKHTGSYYHPYVEGNDYAYLCGNESEFAMDHAAVCRFLDRAEMPVVYGGDFYWSDELYAELCP